MKVTTLQAALGSAALLFSAQAAVATNSHRHAHVQYGKRHSHGNLHPELIDAPKPLNKRATCSLPDHPDLVPVPGRDNNGFAMSPDQGCVDGINCPIACRPGKVMAQWADGTSYIVGDDRGKMAGGLYCDGGVPKKPFPNKPYCQDGTGTVTAVNKCGKVVSFCQTVLPGNEAMLIPTEVTGSSVLAVPGPDYWAGTAAHFYINSPGVTARDACIWGVASNPVGNWAPYVAGMNTVDSGNTFVTLGWNPKYAVDDFPGQLPTFGVRIECVGGGCNGLPCGIDPSKDGANGVGSPVASTGAGGARFCVVTVPKGSSANIIIFNTDGSTGAPAPSSLPPSPPASVTPTAAPAPPAPTSKSTSAVASSSSPPSSSSSSSTHTAPTVLPGIFHENTTYSSGGADKAPGAPAVTTGPKSSSPSIASDPVPTTSKNEGAADQGGAAIAGLIVAIVAAAALY